MCQKALEEENRSLRTRVEQLKVNVAEISEERDYLRRELSRALEFPFSKKSDAAQHGFAAKKDLVLSKIANHSHSQPESASLLEEDEFSNEDMSGRSTSLIQPGEGLNSMAVDRLCFEYVYNFLPVAKKAWESKDFRMVQKMSCDLLQKFGDVCSKEIEEVKAIKNSLGCLAEICGILTNGREGCNPGKYPIINSTSNFHQIMCAAAKASALGEPYIELLQKANRTANHADEKAFVQHLISKTGKKRKFEELHSAHDNNHTVPLLETITEEDLIDKRIRRFSSQFMMWSIEKLKHVLALNGLPKSGKKADLAMKCAKYKVLGIPPLCPKCRKSRLELDRSQELYFCPGFWDVDEERFRRTCDFIRAQEGFDVVEFAIPKNL